jgi:type IV pilus assembly protein PilW
VIRSGTQRGVTLIELMIAMLISLVLIGGTITVYVQARGTQSTSERVAILQDGGRVAMEFIGIDLRQAGLWGRNNVTGAVGGRMGVADQVAAMPAGDCADRWYVDAGDPVDGAEDNNPFAATCLDGGTYVPNSDILIVRHADMSQPLVAGDLTNTGVYIRSDSTHSQIFIGTAVPAGFDGSAQIFPFNTNMFYVRSHTLEASGTALDEVPSLRRVRLAAGPMLIDEEMVRGVEQMQVLYGVDNDADGAVNLYVTAANANFDPDLVVAVRVSLLMRADTEEQGFTETKTYIMTGGDTFAPTDGFRRVMIEKTFHLRNVGS